MTHTLGDYLLFALTEHGSLSRATLRRYFEDLWTNGRNDAKIPTYAFTNLLRALACLGHADTEDHSLAALPARICILANRVAVLSGSRNDDTVAVLRSSASALNISVKVETTEAGNADFLPSKIFLYAQSPEHFASLAKQLSIGCYTVDQIADTNGMANITQYESGLSWTTNRLINWPRKDFSLLKFRFVERDSELDEFGLSLYQNPRTYEQQFRFHRDGEEANVRREWGIFLLLKLAKINAMFFDEKAGVLSAPDGALPPEFERSLVSCMGTMPPSMKSDEGAYFAYYGGVTKELALNVSQKLGQELRFRQLINDTGMNA
jgi:hypothetical protein